MMTVDEEFWDRFLEYDIRSRIRRRGKQLTPACSGILMPGDSPMECEAILREIVSHRRTAFIDSIYTFQESGKPVPRAGEYRVLLNSRGETKCVIRSVGVHIVSLRDITEQEALAEGLDDTFWAWQKRSRERFLSESAARGMSFSMDLQLFVDRFSLAYWEE